MGTYNLSLDFKKQKNESLTAHRSELTVLGQILTIDFSFLYKSNKTAGDDVLLISFSNEVESKTVEKFCIGISVELA